MATDDDERVKFIRLAKLRANSSGQETVHQRRVRLRAEAEGITPEEAERLILDETAAILRGDFSRKNFKKLVTVSVRRSKRLITNKS